MPDLADPYLAGWEVADREIMDGQGGVLPPFKPGSFGWRRFNKGHADRWAQECPAVLRVYEPASEAQGEAAHADGHGPEDCPYALDTTEWLAWQRGWWSAEYDRLVSEPPGPAPVEADGLDALIDWHMRVFAHSGKRDGYVVRMVADLRTLERQAA